MQVPKGLDAITENLENGAAVNYLRYMQQFAYFRLEDLPCSLKVAKEVADHFLGLEYPTIGRTEVEGLYFRQPPSTHFHYGSHIHDVASMAKAVMPPGSGLSGYAALWSAGWTTQIPVSYKFVTCDPGFVMPNFPPPGIAGVEVNTNQRRLELSWHEVTLLEAMLRYPLSDCNWKYAKWALLNVFPERAGHDMEVCRKKVVWAAETENLSTHKYQLRSSQPKGFKKVTRKVKKWLPKNMSKQWDGKFVGYGT